MIEQTLRRLLDEATERLPQKAISAATGVPQPVISRFLNGGSIKLSTVDKLAEYFGLRLVRPQ